MTRVTLVGDEAASGSLVETFARCRAEHGTVSNLYRALAGSPAMLDAWIDFAWALRTAPVVDRALRELIVLRVSQLTESEYEWRIHRHMARSLGLDEAKIGELAEWRSSTAYTDLERAVLALTEELTTSADLTDEAWDAVRALVEERDAIEIVLTAAFYSCVSRVLHALRIPLEGRSNADERG